MDSKMKKEITAFGYYSNISLVQTEIVGIY
jgi:hypothetical protein